MPIGIIINALSILFGGLVGSYIKDYLPTRIKTDLNIIFGVCAISMAINSIILMENMPAVILSVVIGTIIGILLHIGDLIQKAGQLTIHTLFKNKTMSETDMNNLVTIIVLFCASGTGIYGALLSGMVGDNSVLISKSILDFFTALIFACNLGTIVSLVSIPSCIIMLLLFISANIILPYTTPSMINDFRACGGILMLAAGMRMSQIKNFPIADMIPAMVIVMPISYLWITYILPLL